MRFEQQLAVDVRDLDRLIHQEHLRSHRHRREQGGDVLGIHADAAVRHGHAHGERIVGAVDQVVARADGEAHLEGAERILRPRRHDSSAADRRSPGAPCG